MFEQELFTGNIPYHDTDMRDPALARHIVGGHLPVYPGITASVPGLGPELWQLLQKCWDRYPNHRPSSRNVVESIRALWYVPLPLINVVNPTDLSEHMSCGIRESA